MTLPENPTPLMSPEQVADLVASRLIPAIEKVTRLVADGQISYSVRRLADVTDISRTEVYEAIKRSELTPSYPTTNAVILRDEAIRWLMSLPNERPLS